MSRIIVCDTGPLLHLNEAGAMHLLKSAGEVLIPLDPYWLACEAIPVKNF